jgi:hypothetical protein
MRPRLQARKPDYRDGFIHNLKAEVGDQAMQIEPLEKKLEIPEFGLSPPPKDPPGASTNGWVTHP